MATNKTKMIAVQAVLAGVQALTANALISSTLNPRLAGLLVGVVAAVQVGVQFFVKATEAVVETTVTVASQESKTQPLETEAVSLNEALAPGEEVVPDVVAEVQPEATQPVDIASLESTEIEPVTA